MTVASAASVIWVMLPDGVVGVAQVLDGRRIREDPRGEAVQAGRAYGLEIR